MLTLNDGRNCDTTSPNIRYEENDKILLIAINYT